MPFLSKYGVARHIYIPIPKAGVASHAVSADWTPATGDVKISKDGGAAANVTNLPTAIAMGNSAIWDFSLTATEMQAAQINVTVADSATKAVDDTGFIIETHGNASAQFQPDLSDIVRMGLTAIPNAIPGAAAGHIVAGTGTNQIQPSAGGVPISSVASTATNIKKNTALANFEFAMTDSTNHQPATSITVTATRSLDGAAFGACANAVVEVSNGVYKISLAAGDLNANVVTLRFTGTACDDLLITIITTP